jgi:O-antigen/teichoic acid export membrane protein
VARVLGSATVNLGLIAVGLVTTPYVLLGLGTPAYGVLALVTLVSSHLGILDLGFGAATVLHLSRARALGDRREERAVLESSLAVFLASGALAGGSLFLAAPWLAHSVFTIPAELAGEASSALRVGAATLGLSFLSSFYMACFQALGRFDWLNGTRAATGTLFAATAVGAVALGLGVRGVVWGQLAVAALSLAVLALGFARLHGGPLRPGFEPATLRRMAGFGVAVLAGSVAYQWMLNGPPLALAGFATSAELAAFVVPHSVLQKLAMLMAAASLAFFPLASAIAGSADRPRLAVIFESHLRLTLLVLGPIAGYLAAFGERLLAVWIEPGFAAASAPSLRLLACAAVVLGLGSPAADVARGLRRPLWVLIYTVAAAGLGVGGAFAAAATAGGPGAAAAMLAALLLTTVPFVAIVAKRLLALGALRLVAALSGPTTAVAACSGAFLLASRPGGGLLWAVVAGALVTGAYAAAVYAWVLTPREREIAGLLARRERAL